MLRFERKAQREGFSFVIGIDEAGRGPLAGPVVAAAVSLKTHKFKNKIQDSKKMTPLQREAAFHEIWDKAYVGIGIASEAVVDSHNILRATFHVMSVAVDQLLDRLDSTEAEEANFSRQVCLLVDGNIFKTDLPFAYRTIVNGDNLSLSIACASVIAKVTRDRILKVYDKVFPQYGFGEHKGYATLDHRLAIQKYGRSMIHRKSFQTSLTDDVD